MVILPDPSSSGRYNTRPFVISARAVNKSEDRASAIAMGALDFIVRGAGNCLCCRDNSEFGFRMKHGSSANYRQVAFDFLLLTFIYWGEFKVHYATLDGSRS